MLNGNTLIKGRWKIIKKIGAGAFGEIYAAKCIVTSQQVAIKVERADSKKQVLKLEVAVLKKLQSSPYVCRFITCGRSGDYNFLVMELMGENLSELRRKQAGPAGMLAGSEGKFSMLTTLKLGIIFIKALQHMHDQGYIHRDVKPSNFVIGRTRETAGEVYIIDFGLARKYIGPNGEVKSSREQTGFRGTARYASIHSHLCQDLGRRDDLWSVLYILIEFVRGTLPWKKLKDKEKIGELKIRLNGPDLVAGLPTEFLQFMDHLQTLEYADRPDYDYLIGLLQSRFEKLGGNENFLFDWQINQQPTDIGLIDRLPSGAIAPSAAAAESDSLSGGPESNVLKAGAPNTAISTSLQPIASSNPGMLSSPSRVSLLAGQEQAGPVYKLVANKKLGGSGHVATPAYSYATRMEDQKTADEKMDKMEKIEKIPLREEQQTNSTKKKKTPRKDTQSNHYDADTSSEKSAEPHKTDEEKRALHNKHTSNDDELVSSTSLVQMQHITSGIEEQEDSSLSSLHQGGQENTRKPLPVATSSSGSTGGEMATRFQNRSKTDTPRCKCSII